MYYERWQQRRIVHTGTEDTGRDARTGFCWIGYIGSRKRERKKDQDNFFFVVLKQNENKFKRKYREQQMNVAASRERA